MEQKRRWGYTMATTPITLLTHSYIIAILFMKLSEDAEMAEWLAQFIPDPDHFDWDKGNRHKIVKHNVAKEDVESLLQQETFVFAGRIVEPVHSEWRGLTLGVDGNKRLLSLIFTLRGELLRPISCRPMRKEEAKIYHAKTKN